MSKQFFDYESGSFAHSTSENMAVDYDGNFLMRMSDSMAMDMETGDMHMVSSWPDDEEGD